MNFKKHSKFKVLLIFFVLIMISFSLASCEIIARLICAHLDSDSDGRCDFCGADLGGDSQSGENGEDDGGNGSTGGSTDNESDETCDAHTDVNLDGRCDSCKTSVEVKYDGTLTLVKDGVPTFQVVFAADLGSNRVAAQRIVGNINKCLGETKVVSLNDASGAQKPIEILIGSVENRDEKYNIDKYSLGYEGYVIEIIDSKLVVQAGSESAMAQALKVLESDVLGIQAGKTINELKICESIKKPQTAFEIESMKVGGKYIEEYVIATDLSNNYAYAAAEVLRNAIYKSTGKYLALKRPAAVAFGAPTISIEIVEKGDERSCDDGFSASVKTGGRIEIFTEFPNKLSEAVEAFAEQVLLADKADTVDIKENVTYSKNVRNIFYADYGAVGDGVTDDSEAIRKAHEYANQWGHDVFAEAGKTYLIGKTDSSIIVQTNTDWCGSTIIFNDTSIRWDDKDARSVWVFKISSKLVPNGVSVSVPSGMTLSAGQTNIGITFDAPCMLRLRNSEHKIYVRYGNNANSGDDQQEYILVDENGNVDPSTPILYDYEKITSITRYSTTDEPISVGNGTVKTIAPNPKTQDPDYENNYCYFHRGIYVIRSNTTLYNLTQVIEGEDMTVEVDRNGDGTVDIYDADKSYGVPYKGTIYLEYCANVKLTDSTVEGHQAYSFWQTSGSGVSRNEMGSYAITVSNCIGITLSGVRQYENAATGEVITNRQMYHGVISSNYCRNVTVTDSYLDRFDAHKGLHNATLTDSTFGFGILIIGGGTLRIENVTRLSGDPFVMLRNDYNSVFDGDVVIKNCVAGSSIKCVFAGNWLKHNTGLPNYMVRNVYIDGLKAESGTLYIFNIKNATEAALSDSVNPLYLPSRIEVSGIVGVDGVTAITPKTSKNSDAFAGIAIEFK